MNFRCSIAFGTLLLIWVNVGPVANAQWREVFYPYWGGPHGWWYSNEIFFTDTLHGFVALASDTPVQVTWDGGDTWNEVPLPGASPSGGINRHFSFLSRLTGYISGSDGVWRTTDGGNSWLDRTPPFVVRGTSSVGVPSEGAAFFESEERGVFLWGRYRTGEIYFSRTSDGGRSWEWSIRKVADTLAAIGGVVYHEGSYFAVGSGGQFFRSSDGGSTWEQSSTGSKGWQEDIVACGDYLYVASSGITTYTLQRVDSSRVMVSTDRGETWSSVVPTGNRDGYMWGVSCVSEQEAWASGGDGTGLIYRTIDGGTTWTNAACGVDGDPKIDALDDIWFIDRDHGWATGRGLWRYEPEALRFAGGDRYLCPGGEVQLQMNAPDAVRWEWSPADGLSCTDCPDPIASPEQTTTYHVAYGRSSANSWIGTCWVYDTVRVVVEGESLSLSSRSGVVPGEDVEPQLRVSTVGSASQFSELKLRLEWDKRVMEPDDPSSAAGDWVKDGVLRGWISDVEERGRGYMVITFRSPGGSLSLGEGDLLIRPRFRTFFGDDLPYVEEDAFDVEISWTVMTDATGCLSRSTGAATIGFNLCGLVHRLMVIGSGRYRMESIDPNPVRERTEIRFSLGLPGATSVELIDVHGTVVASLVDQYLSEGSWRVAFDPTIYPTGIYFIRVGSRDWVEIRTVMVVR